MFQYVKDVAQKERGMFQYVKDVAQKESKNSRSANQEMREIRRSRWNFRKTR